MTELEMTTYEAVMIAEGVQPADYDDQIAAWQLLVNSGLAWSLQGFFGRTANHLIISPWLLFRLLVPVVTKIARKRLTAELAEERSENDKERKDHRRHLCHFGRIRLLRYFLYGSDSGPDSRSRAVTFHDWTNPPSVIHYRCKRENDDATTTTPALYLAPERAAYSPRTLRRWRQRRGLSLDLLCILRRRERT